MRIGIMLCGVFLVMRFADLAVRGVLPLAFRLDAAAIAFWVETILFAIHIFLAWTPAARRDPRRLFIAATTMALAGIAYRLSAYLIAYDTGAGWTYFPSIGEVAVSVGLVSFEALAFILCVKLLPVLPSLPKPSVARAHAEI